MGCVANLREARGLAVPLLAVAAAAVWPGNAGAATIRVNCATQNLQAKIAAAPPGSTLLVRGTCHGNYVVAKALTLDGDPHATLDGDDTGSTLQKLGPGTLRLVDLRIVDGNATGGGGGILGVDGTLILLRTTVAGNFARLRGGGIESSGPLTLRRSVVRENRVRLEDGGPSVFGGGIYAGSLVRLERSRVSGNVATAVGNANPTLAAGGGLFVNNGLRAIRSQISGNTARADGPSPAANGGGVATEFEGPRVTLIGSTLEGNAAIADAIVGNADAVGGAVYATRAVASRTQILTNRVDAVSPAGSADAYGGGLYVFVTGAKLTKSRVSGSTASADGLRSSAGGGAIWGASDAGGVVLARSRLVSNRVEAASSDDADARGGAIRTQGPISADRSTIDRNTAVASSTGGTAGAVGGGIEIFNNPVELLRSTISRNRIRAAATGTNPAYASAGGIDLSSVPSARFVNSTVAANSARALAETSSPGGQAYAVGGGVIAGKTLLELVHTTIANNSVGGRGAMPEFRAGGLLSILAAVELRATLIAANRATIHRDCSGEVTSNGNNLIARPGGCVVTTPRPSDHLGGTASLRALADRGGPTQTIALGPESDALNAIPRSGCSVSKDQRGVRRPQQNRCEIGAYESKP